MALVEVSVIPLGTQAPSIASYIAAALRILKGDAKIKYELTPMGTVIEGDLDHVLKIVGEMHRAVFRAGAVRVVTTVKIDERSDEPSTIAHRLDSVYRELDGK